MYNEDNADIRKSSLCRVLINHNKLPVTSWSLLYQRGLKSIEANTS